MRLKTIGLISILVIGLLAGPLPAEAQQPKKIYRIGWLSNATGARRTLFKQIMRELGYVEGKNFVLERRFAKGKLDRLPKLAAELTALKVDILITSGVAPTRAAKEATNTIPIVMANASDDPVRQGLVASLARPGGNITGYIDAAEETAAKRLELLKEAVPKMSRVGILWTSSPAGTANFKNAEVAARVLELQPQSLEVQRSDDLENAFRAAVEGRAEALYMVMFGGVFRSQRARVLDLEVTTRLPAIYGGVNWVRRGGLMSYAHDRREQYRRVAQLVDKIFKGADPGLLPVERPTKFNLVINLKTAKQIGFTVPPGLLFRADKVIK